MPLEGKGHAHDPLEDDVWLNIGPNADESGPGVEEDSMTHIVSESPPPASFHIYEKAYEEEVSKIQEDKGHHTKVYLTRRVEGAVNSKLQALGSLGAGLHRTASGDKDSQKKTFTGGLADIVNKTKGLHVERPKE